MQIKRLNHNQRKAVKAQVKSGVYSLRVIGSEKLGFALAAERKNSLVVISRIFRKQNKAMKYGVDKYGQVAKKLRAAMDIQSAALAA